VFPTFVAGGAQVRTARLMAGLGSAYRHAVLALDGTTDALALVPPDVALEIVPAFPKAGSLRTVRALRSLLRSLRPALVLTYNWGAIDGVIAARLFLRGRVVHHEDGFGPDEADGFKRRRVWTRRVVLSGADAVVVPSFTLAELATGTWGLAAGRVHRIANGIRVEEFPTADGNRALRNELGIPARAFVVGSVGHLRTEKNPLRFVEAFARVRAQEEVHGLVLGDGPEREGVLARARALGVDARLHLVGHRPEPQGYYRAMDAFCLSSDTEQMPVALLEAMAAKLPVVATDVGDVRRILPPEQHALVVGRDASALAEGLSELALDAERRARLGAANHAHVRATYSFETMLSAYRARYEHALRT